MKKTLIAGLLRVAIVIVAVFGIMMCTCWYPFSISLSVMGVIEAVPTVAQNVRMWTQVVFYWLASLPCFAVLVLWWLMTYSLKKGTLFNKGNVKLTKLSAGILFVDLVVFLIGNVVFLFLGWNDFAIIYFILSAIGLGIVITIKVFERRLKRIVKQRESAQSPVV